MVHLLQAKPKYPNITFIFIVLATHKTPFPARAPGKAFFVCCPCRDALHASLQKLQKKEMRCNDDSASLVEPVCRP